MNIEKFERKIGMKIEGLNRETFLKIIKDPEYKDYTGNPKDFSDLLLEILNRNTDTKFRKQIYTLKYLTDIFNNESILDNLFKMYREEKITREKLLETMEQYKNSTDSLFVISVFACSLIALEDVSLKKQKKILVDNIESVKKIFEEISDVESSYTLRCKIIDLIYFVKTRFFSRYKISIDVSWIDDEIKILHEYEDKLSNNRELPEINIKPEQLGFIDITKFKKE